LGSSAIAFSQTLASGPVTVFPGEISQASRSWAERAYHFHEVDKGGHFAAWEEPELFCERAPRGVQITALGRGRRNGQRLKAPTRRTS